jgi:branched-chain amino acid transport system substrate-binding protein
VLIGVATSPPFVEAARMAIADELALAPLPGLDTEMIPEASSLASPAIQAAQRLVQREALVAVIGHANSSASLAAAPIYGAHEVVQVAPTASAPVFSGLGPYSFRLVPSDDRQGAFLAEQLRAALPNGGSVALVYVNDDYGRGLRAALLEHIPRELFPVVLDLPHVETRIEDADVAHAVTAIRAVRPAVVLWLARGSTLARFIAPLREVLPDALILGGDAASELHEGSRDGWGEVSFVEYVDLEATEALRDFERRYRARFGRDPVGPDALTYDAIRLVLAGIRSGARTGPALREYLVSLGRESPPYPGLTGPIAFDDDGDVDRPYLLATVGRQDGE